MESAEQSKNNDKPWLFKKGQSGNPSGRPKGTKSLKTYAKEMIENMNDEERQIYLDGLPKNFIWEMAEGKARQDTDITSGGKPIPLFNNVISNGIPDNQRNSEDTKPQ